MAVASQAKKAFVKRSSAEGSYYTSVLSKRALKHVLRGYETTHFKTAEDTATWLSRVDELRYFDKLASIGGEQEQGFEQAFSSLAYTYLKDKAPRLLDFIVGFQLVDRNEDNTKAIGMFGFKVGDQWLYAPIFFLNGDLKGHELLYVKKQDMFVPMKENWVNYLISRKPHVLGEGVNGDVTRMGGLHPDLSRLRRSPHSKFGSDGDIASWAQPFMPVLCALALKKAGAVYAKQAGDLNFPAVVGSPLRAAMAQVAERFDLRNVIGDLPMLKSAMETAYNSYPLVKKGFDTFYPDFFKNVEAGDLVKRAESYLAPPPSFLSKKKDSDSLIPDDEEKETDKKAELVIYAAAIDEDVAIKENVSEADRDKLRREGVLIKDDRKKTSVAYNTQTKLELVNPTETGLYEVLERPGSFDEMLVISNPHAGNGRRDFCLVLRKNAPRDWKNIYHGGLWAKQGETPDPTAFKKYVDGLGGVETLKEGGTYVAIAPDGSGTCPFRIRDKKSDETFTVSWEDHASGRPLGKIRSYDRWDEDYNSWDATVTINRRAGTKLRSSRGVLSIPDAYKIVEVTAPPKPEAAKDDSFITMCSPCVPHCGDESKNSPIEPGNIIDVQLMLTKQANTLRLHSIGQQMSLKYRGENAVMTKKAALIHLVRDHGLTEAQSRDMIRQAEALDSRNRAAEFLVKYAYGYDPHLSNAPNAPAIPEQQYGSEPLGPYNSVRSTYPDEQEYPVEGLQASNTDQSVYDPFYRPDQNAMQIAQQAAASGQKEVFDTAMVSGMLKAVRQDSLVDRHLGDLMKALNSLGRIIFMFFWHQEEFQDRYGKQDLPELEDSLRNAFEVLGDVVLFLKEKTVGGGAGSMNMSGVGGAGDDEPDIQEAARN